MNGSKIEIRHYRLVSELSEHIDQLRSAGNPVRFVVPSSKDRRWWRQRAHLDQFGPCSGVLDEAKPWIWQDLYEDICGAQRVPPRKLIAPPERLLILRQLLKDTLTQRVKKDKTLLQRWPGLERPSFLNDLSSGIQELLNEAVTPEQLIEPEGEGADKTPADWLLPEVYSAYLAYLKKYDLLDSAQIWTVAKELLTGDPDDTTGVLAQDLEQNWGRNLTLVFTGFMSLTHGQLELLMALGLVCKKIVFLKPEPFMNDFYDLDEQFESVEPELSSGLMWSRTIGPVSGDRTEKIDLGHIIELLSAEPVLEPETVARELALWSNGKGKLANAMPFPGFENIGIMIAAQEVDAMVSALNRYALPFTLENGPSVAQTLPGRVLSIIRRLRSMNFPTHETALLMTQPCFAGASFSTEKAIWANRTGLDNWEKYLAETHEKDAVNSAASDRTQALFTALLAIRAIKKFCKKLDRGGKPAVIMEAFLEFLTTKGLWLDRVRDLPSDIQELDESIRALNGTINQVEKKALALREMLPDIGPIGERTLKDDDAFEFLSIWCRENALLPHLPRTGTLHLYAGIPPVLASWPVWIMLDTTQKRWQSPIPGSVLLNDTVRARIEQNNANLPDAKDKMQQREALFRRLLQTGEVLTIVSRPRADEKGRVLPETVYTGEFIRDIRKHFGLMTTNGESVKPDMIDATDLNFLTGSAAFRFSSVDPNPLAEIRRFPPVIMPVVPVLPGSPSYDYLAVSDLSQFLSCPFQWWLKKQAKLRERATGLFQPWQQGTIVHILFQETWRRLWSEHDINVVNFDFSEFTKIMNDEWTRMFSQVDDGPYKQFSRIINDSRFVRRLDLIHAGLQRLGDTQARILEAVHSAGWRHDEIYLEEDAQLDYKLDGIAFTGQCDRIEILSSSRSGRRVAFISDYKLNNSTSYDKGFTGLPAGPDGESQGITISYGLQLSAYALLFASSDKKKFRDIDIAGVGFLGVRDGKMAGTFIPELGLDSAALKDDVVQTKPKTGKKDGITGSDLLETRKLEAKYALEYAAALLKKGEFRPCYSADYCKRCKLKGICRKEEFRRSNFNFNDENDSDADNMDYGDY